MENLSYNFVAFALSGTSDSEHSRSAGLEASRPSPALHSAQDVVLKIGVPRDELVSEMAALRLFNGEGACRLIDCDEDKGFLLLERLRPGVMLSTLEDDEETTRIAADVMKRIWRSGLDTAAMVEWRKSVPRPAAYSTTSAKFILLSDWFDGLKRLRAMFNGGTGPLDEKLVVRVEACTKDFFTENHMPVLLHGDFHHYNILSSERGWLVIDPKGVIGPAGYEVGPFMVNPWGSFSDRISLALSSTEGRRVVARRVDIFHEVLGFERQRIIEWSLAHSILSAWWGIEDNTGWEYARYCANLFAGLK